MRSINIPRTLTEESALALLTEATPNMLIGEVRDFDFRGKDAIFVDKDAKLAFICKLVAAKGYEDRENQQVNTTWCYLRASDAAYKLELFVTSLRCAQRAKQSYHTGLDALSRTSDSEQACIMENLVRLQHMISDLERDYADSTLSGNGHKWFIKVRRQRY